MIETLLCSLVTVLPDFLFRRYVQDKRWGRELTIFSIWHELRYGITACVILTVSLITMIFYYHPATTTVSSFFRTVTILPEAGGRVEEVYVENYQDVKAGDRIFKLDDSTQAAAVETARRQIAEVEAQMELAQSELAAADGQIGQARAALKQAEDERARKLALVEAGSSAVSEQEVDRLNNLFDQRTAGLEAAEANRQSVVAKIETLLPAQKASAEAGLAQAEAELAKTLVVAGVDGRIEQFTLRPGDFVSALLRPAGILVPSEAGRLGFQAGFGQIGAQIIKPGMVAEITCMSHPFTVVPMVVTDVQNVIAAGQVRPSDSLLEIGNLGAPGTLTVFMEPLYEGQTEPIPPGSSCMANAYTTFDHSEGISLAEHVIEATGLVHAAILRIQALLLPVRTLVLSGH